MSPQRFATRLREMASPPWLSLLRSRPGLLFAAALLVGIALEAPARGTSQHGAIPPKSHIGASASHVSKTMVDLQRFRHTSTIAIDAAGGQKGTATLINLNPTINVWYLLQLTGHRGTPAMAYHLENRHPDRQRLFLDEDYPHGLVIAEGAETYACDLWAAPSQHRLDAARRLYIPYAPICADKLYLRNPVNGHRTVKETVTDFLRDTIWGGEQLVGFVRDTFFKDAYLERATLRTAPQPTTASASQTKSVNAPKPALIDPHYEGRVMVPHHLGLNLQYPMKHGIALGRWYAVEENPGIYVSVMQPKRIVPDILQSHTTVVNRLDSVEATATVYVVAFDLERFELGFALGTDHPRVGWSERVLDSMKALSVPGPDGIGRPDPLVATGLINPQNAPRTVATFTAGFKRSHGAFKYGNLAHHNHGSHYGFIEHGVVFSTLQPGLATLLVNHDGSIHLKTWTEGDNTQLARIRHARQNGVPIIEFDARTQTSVPGPLVGRWGRGNWSGSVDRKLRTVRAGVCLQERQGGRFLLYGYFSSATPSAMARVFQAYGCRYAMHLDMNALEHTYLAVYRRQGSNVMIQHLIREMSVLDKSEAGPYVPRFVGYADNRDFFYVMRREHRKATP